MAGTTTSETLIFPATFTVHRDVAYSWLTRVTQRLAPQETARTVKQLFTLKT